MAIAELISAAEYLHTSFEHDAEFVEGRIVERSLPTWEHSCIQGYLLEVLRPLCRTLGLYAVPEQRIQTAAGRYRVPDVCVVAEKPTGAEGRKIVTTPPHLCIEILSPDDTTAQTLEKVREYRAFGVPWIWIIDPVTRTGQIHGPDEIVAVDNKLFRTDRFQVDLAPAEV